MRRDLARLADTRFDLLVVGAGIHGACAAWDAALRGLSVAIVDQNDFGAATSANSLRIVHGGLRYLVRGDLPRALESIRERTALLRIAPGLVEPFPVLVPTTGHGSRGPAPVRAALALNDILSFRRNRGVVANRRIPSGRVISRAECLALFPGFADQEKLTGGAIWYDARLIHPERLILSFVRSAAERGAAVANYARIERLTIENDAVTGAAVRDRLTGAEFEIRSRATLIAAGHWTRSLIPAAENQAVEAFRSHALGVNVVLRKRLADMGVGIQARSGPERDPICGGGRYLFLAPSGSTTTLGTWYAPAEFGGRHSSPELGAGELVRELQEACPALNVRSSDIVHWQYGWLPLKAGLEPGRPDALAERPSVVNHGPKDGVRHLFSMEGVKLTTARGVAQRAVDLIVRELGRQPVPCVTAQTPLDTGPDLVSLDVAHAVREEMAITLSDLVFRRTTLGTPPGPGRAMVQDAARRMGAELGWDVQHQEGEVEEVMRQIDVPGRSLEAVG